MTSIISVITSPPPTAFIKDQLFSPSNCPQLDMDWGNLLIDVFQPISTASPDPAVVNDIFQNIIDIRTTNLQTCQVDSDCPVEALQSCVNGICVCNSGATSCPAGQSCSVISMPGAPKIMGCECSSIKNCFPYTGSVAESQDCIGGRCQKFRIESIETLYDYKSKGQNMTATVTNWILQNQNKIQVYNVNDNTCANAYNNLCYSMSINPNPNDVTSYGMAIASDLSKIIIGDSGLEFAYHFMLEGGQFYGVTPLIPN